MRREYRCIKAGRQACASRGLGSGVCDASVTPWARALDNVPCRPLCFVAVKIPVITLSPVKTPLCEIKIAARPAAFDHKDTSCR